MSILSVIALFGAGYMYRDYSQYKTWRRPVNYNYGGYSYNRPQTIKQYLKNVAMDKMDVIFYGTKPKKKRESRIDYDSYYKDVCNGIKNYASSKQYEIDPSEYYDTTSIINYDKEVIYVYADRFADSGGKDLDPELVELFIGKDFMKKLYDLEEGDALYVRNDQRSADYEIIMDDEKYYG